MKVFKARAAIAFFFLLSPLLLAQTEVKPGFNLFSVEQDIEVGRQSAREAEGQLPLLRDESVEEYVDQIGSRLAQHAPGARFPYDFKVVNASDVNAFALPGGFMYINRGLIEAVESEGELAGVMAHEIAHVALRHGTNQASKAYLAQAGLGVLGGLLGGGSTSQIMGLIGGFGLNAVFLKFSRTAEEQADIVGAQILARAGYDPMDLARMFETLRRRAGRDPGKVEQFFSSHPSPANRSARIQREASLLQVSPLEPVGDLATVKNDLAELPSARPLRELAQERSQPDRRREPGRIVVEAPSRRFRTYEEPSGFFTISYPENWQVFEGNGPGVTIAPRNGIIEHGNGQESIVYGVVVNHYDPFGTVPPEGSFSIRPFPGRTPLEEATNDLITQIIESNPHLRMVRRSEKRVRTSDGAEALLVALSGRSPATLLEERVMVYSRELQPDQHVLYSLLIAPGRDFRQLEGTFNQMITSLRVDDAVAHR